MNRFSRLLLLLTLAAALPGCQRQEEAGPLVLSGRLFVFNYRVAIATYLVTLSRSAALPEGSIIEATFENPQKAAPLVLRQKVFPVETRITLQSPPVHCVVKDRPYAVGIRLFAADGRLLQSLETTVTSSDDQTILPAKPLVVGPLYAPNPDVFRGDGSTDFAPERACPT